MELKDLIERGYFPKELPPAFNTSKLAQNLDQVISRWHCIFENNTKKTSENFVLKKDDRESPQVFNKRKKEHEDNFKRQYNSSKTIYFSISKGKRSRRFLGIPNPKHFIILSEKIIDNWSVFDKVFKESLYSKSFPTPEKDRNKRAVSTYSKNLSFFINQRIRNSFDKFIELRVDISKFYPTIYTHSLTWALLGKEKAKKYFGLCQQNKLDDCISAGDADAELYKTADEIDACIRSCQDKQSIGIPIGPDTSHIIAEAIACRIDNILQEKFKDIDLKGCRYYDDYYLFVSTRDEAEKVVKILQKILADFQLEINESKLSIKEFPFAFEDDLGIILSQVNFKNKNLENGIKHYFSLTWGLVEKNPYKADSIFKYALKTFELRTIEVPKENWKLFENLLLKTALLEPAVLDIVTRILLSYQNFLNQESKNKIKNLIEQTIKNHSQMGHDFEVAWSLWLAKTFEITIEDDIVNYVFEMRNPISLLILLDIAKTTQLINNNPDFSKLENQLDCNTLFSEDWLLAYEGIKKGWLTPSTDIIEKNEFFKILRDLDIEFYDSSRQLKEYSPKTKDQDNHQKDNYQETPESTEQKQKKKTPEMKSKDIAFLFPSNLY